MDVALMIEGQDGLNWPLWQRLVRAAEDLGYAGIYRSDHFTNAQGPYKDALELWTSLTWVAGNTSRIEFGPMVSPVSFRNPVVTAWTAAAIDDLSGGRLQLGLGAGWQEREHRNFGFDLLDLDARFTRFEEGLKVVRQLMRGDEPGAFDGDFYHLEDAVMLPHPGRKNGPPIVIGGNGPLRTLPLAAIYADEWNAVYVTAARFAELCAKLDGLLEKQGRPTSAVRRTLMTRVVYGKTRAEAEAKIEDAAGMRERGVLIGDADDIVAGLQELAKAGVQRVMAQWLDLDDMAGIEAIARDVLPRV